MTVTRTKRTVTKTDHRGDCVARGVELSRSFTCHTAHTSTNVAEQGTSVHIALCRRSRTLDTFGRTHTVRVCARNALLNTLLKGCCNLREFAERRWHRNRECASPTRRQRRISRYAETYPSRRNHKKKDLQLALGS